jgi:hypothetical protein
LWLGGGWAACWAVGKLAVAGVASVAREEWDVYVGGFWLLAGRGEWV